ncbi:MAG TPA: HAMP domain-containing protein [Candidatus Brachybacterium merdigallinarum]|nr:HAMP domain-containing protein [Candidatus Brachybacterium merdigallinarum]
MTTSRARSPEDPSARRAWTVRIRVLTTMLTFMAIGLAATGVLTYVVQFRVLEDRVTGELNQEISELSQVADTREEDGAFAHTSVDSLLATATISAVPSDNESVLALIDDEPRYKPQVQDFDLSTYPHVVEAVIAAHEQGRTVPLTVEIEGREVRMLVASVNVAGDQSQGIFVVANDISTLRRDLWRSAATFTLLSVAAMLVAGWVGYLVIGRLLRPLENLRAATEEITVEDLNYRVPVPEEKDDIAALAENFNRMLERIQNGFSEQRRFMSDVGHELRTPLTIVSGTLEMTDPDDPQEVRESRDIAMDELDRMSRIVGDLSELAASARPHYVTPAPLDMAPFARSVFARIERIAERDWILEDAVDVVADADEQRLTQAVVQLAANAVRYSEEGTRIRFGVTRVLGAAGPEIHVSVADEGMGIAPEDQRRIFERFTRVDPARTGGSGLGLPIVLAIAEGHGGVVRLLSAPGRGSTFTLVFPQFTMDNESGAGDDPPEAPATTGRKS